MLIEAHQNKEGHEQIDKKVKSKSTAIARRKEEGSSEEPVMHSSTVGTRGEEMRLQKWKDSLNTGGKESGHCISSVPLVYINEFRLILNLKFNIFLKHFKTTKIHVD